MEKLNLQEFVGQIAQQTGWTKKESDEMLKSFLTVIVEGLETDEQVKIKGLGTFKRVWNAPRQSVNIKTGEKFEIAGHYKVSFTPENELKDLINKPYAHLATTYIEEEVQAENPKSAKREPDNSRLNLSKLSNEAQGLLAIIDEINSQNKSVIPEKKPTIVEEEESEKEVAVDEYVAEETTEEENAEETQQEPQPEVIMGPLPRLFAVDKTRKTLQPKTFETETEKPKPTVKPATKTEAARAKVAANVAVATTMPTFNEPVTPDIPVAKKEDKKKKKCRRGCIWLTVLGLLLAAAVLAYYFLFAPFKIKFDMEEKTPQFELPNISAFIASFNKNNAPEDETYNELLTPTKEIELESDTIDILKDTIALQNMATEEVIPQPQPDNSAEYLDEVVVKVGDSLRKFAIKYYGNSIFWVYIYEANREKIPNPDNVPLGAKLRIPKLDKHLLDLNNPETELRTNQMRREILR